MSLSLFQWNMRGFFANKPYLQAALPTLNPTVLALQETHLRPHHTPTLPGYTSPAIRKDRPHRRGGGVALFVQLGVPFTELPLTVDLEAVAVRLHLPDGPVTVCSLYLSPDAPSDELPTILTDLMSTLPLPVVVLADVNAHHILWGSPVADRRGKLLSDWIMDSALVSLNTGSPTYISSQGQFSHIDLSLCSAILAPSLQWSVSPDPLNSDHFPIIIETAIDHGIVPQSPRWCVDQANWGRFNELVLFPVVYTNPTEDCLAITSSLFEAATLSVPRKCPSSRRAAHWWTQECTAAKRRMRTAFTQYRNHLSSIPLWIQYKRARAEFRMTIKTARTESWQTYLGTITADTPSSEVWHKIRCLRKRPSPRAIVLREQGTLISSAPEVAEILSNHFTTQCAPHPLFQERKDVVEAIPLVFSPDNTAPYNSPFTFLELSVSLSGSTSKSPGPDSIPYQFLQQLCPAHQQRLLVFFNFVFSTGYPDSWREGQVIPLTKPQKPTTDKLSYRPITLTNCLSKLFGKMITRRLQYFLASIDFYSPTQSGFRAGHSTLDGLCRLENAARNAILMGHYCVTVLLDITKAFDSVWHHGLLLKLSSLGLAGNLARVISEFLTNRRLSVRVANIHSSFRNAPNGVPQGSVLSPTLFTVLINDIFDEVPNSVHTSLYADDGALWVTAPTLPQALAHMQEALDAVERWTYKWGLALSPAKTQAIVFTNRRIVSPRLLLHNLEIPFVTSVKFLGVIFDTRLTWKRHIDYVYSRCLSDLNLLRVLAASRYGADFTSLRRLYISLALPKLDYASFLFSSAATCHLLRLDRIQFAACRILLGALRCTRTSLLEAEANLMPLRIRRNQLMLLYGSRVASIPSHPVREELLRYRPHHFQLRGNYHLSAIARMFDQFQQAHIPPHSIPLIPMCARYSFCTLPVAASLSEMPKTDRSPSQWRAVFCDLHASRYSTCRMVFTDGAKSLERSGSAVWSPQFSIMARLPASTSVFTAELFAIFLALLFLKTTPGRFVLYTDSLSAIAALQTLRRSSHHLLSRILSLLESFPPGKVFLEWVPSHVGIEGNEMADRLAGRSLTLQTITLVHPSAMELRSTIGHRYFCIWSSQWSALSPDLVCFKPELPPPFLHLPRRHQVPVARLRLSCSQLSHGHHFRHCPPPLCPLCDVSITHEHLLLDCPLHDTLRYQLRLASNHHRMPFALITLLHQEFPTAVLIAFLREAGYLHSL